MNRSKRSYLAASEAVAAARLRYAEAFLRFKARHATSDGQAA